MLRDFCGPMGQPDSGEAEDGEQGSETGEE